MHLEKRVLITAGANLLGSHLCERLLADGTIIVRIDNSFTGARRVRGNVAQTISKANDTLAWAAQMSLSDGLVRTIECFQGLLSDQAIRRRSIPIWMRKRNVRELEHQTTRAI
jgi:NAD(P)-dependent dehydrogenase (short-subunit alcohol dehydrogenase family)